ncbi:MAG: phage tail protein [Massilia sp.]
MSSPFVAEIRMFPFNFAPTGWARCDGQLMPISQNTALFSLLGTTYGGDGRSTFALPNLMDSAGMHIGYNQPGPGLSTHDLGEQSGTSTVSLLASEMPVHTHQLQSGGTGAGPIPGSSSVLGNAGAAQVYTTATTDQLASLGTASVGGNPHNNRQPYVALQFCIALQGVFPPRQ